MPPRREYDDAGRETGEAFEHLVTVGDADIRDMRPASPVEDAHASHAQGLAAAASPAPTASEAPDGLSEADADEALRALHKAARARARAEKRAEFTLEELKAAVRTAREFDKSLREIAAIAGVSYDTIDRWTKES